MADPRLGLDLPQRVDSLEDALRVLRVLWPTLHDALEPGPRRRAYGRRHDERAPISPVCEACGGPRTWRRLTGLPGERMRPYCPGCDKGTAALAASPSPVALCVLQAMLEAEAALAAAGYTIAGAPAAVTLKRTRRVRGQRADAAADGLVHAARRVLTALGDVEPVIRIDARCPWCQTGALIMWPERGPTNRHNIAGLVECTHRDCECEDEQCRCHRRGEVNPDGRAIHAHFRHRWTNADWPWLSRRLGINLFDVARRV